VSRRKRAPFAEASQARRSRGTVLAEARAEAEARGYIVESVTWSEELGAPVVQVWAGVQSVSREEPS
jgi:hypothetical protein